MMKNPLLVTIRTGLTLAVALILTACNSGGSSGPIVPPASLVSIAVTPANPNLPLNRVRQLIATGTYSNSSTRDITTSVTWSSGNTNIATVTADGEVAPGATASNGQSTAITATDAGSGINGNTTVTIAAAATVNISDPLVAQQWHLNNTGQIAYSDRTGVAGNDINVDTVYAGSGIDGSGVRVAVVDTGLEIAHEDLSANVVPGGSWDFKQKDTDPTYPKTDGDHGTSVSGLIAATAGNGVGGMGVAPGARLKGFNALQVLASQTAALVDSLGGSSSKPNSQDVAVFNQSYGISPYSDVPVNPAIEAQLAWGVSNLRSGKGGIYVKAAGNGFNDIGGNSLTCSGAAGIGISCENANFDADNALPYNIVAGALNADGEKSSYSTTGSALWIISPGGEYGANASVIGSGAPLYVYEPAMITTDQSGCDQGYAQFLTNPGANPISTFDEGQAPNTNCNYTNSMNGTSSATPVTAGVAALILAANPDLTWRDVKHILASTATPVNTGKAAITVVLNNGNWTVEPAWTTNGAGYNFHNWYGFGRVNAAAAVAMAQGYTLGSLGSFQNTGWLSSGSLNLAIPDNNFTGVTRTMNVATSLTIEEVQIQVSATHPFIADLGIELTSPAGTRSVLKYVRDGLSNANLDNMLLASNAFYGESSNGTWTFKIVDGWSTDTGTLTGWNLRIYGH